MPTAAKPQYMLALERANEVRLASRGTHRATLALQGTRIPENKLVRDLTAAAESRDRGGMLMSVAAIIGRMRRRMCWWRRHELVDGVFDREMERQVRAFQRSRGLVPDGVVGEKTHAALDEAAASRVDAKAAELGQTRRVYVERALALVLAEYGFEDVVTDDRMPPGGFAVVNDKDAVYVPPAAADRPDTALDEEACPR